MKEFEFDFVKSAVCQKSLVFIGRFFDIHKTLTRGHKISIGSNLTRAGLSIANNPAEGNGKKSKKEKQRYFWTSLDSARERISVFNALRRQKPIDEDNFKNMRTDGREITSMLRSLIDSQN